jgi:two-component system chemotaxis response regulator CheY
VKPESLRLLIVDDMPAVRAIVRDMLEAQGFRHFQEAEDGESAWRMLRDSAEKEHLRPHLVISDWLMPGIDGLELVSNVRKLPAIRELPFLMITSQSDREHWLRAEDAGVSGFVVKPFDPQQLREQLLRALAPKT